MATNAYEEIVGQALRRGLGDQPAVIWRDDVVSFAALDRRINRFGQALRQRGVEPGDRVLLMMLDTPDLVAAWLGAVKVGAVAVALNIRAAAKDLAFMLSDSGAKALLLDQPFEALWDEAATMSTHRPDIVAVRPDDGFDGFLGDASEVLETAPTDGDDVAFWLYTSGTTGTPKAAMHRHRSVALGDLHVVRSLGVQPGDRLFCSSKLFFAFALGHCLIGALRAGAAIILDDGWPDSAAVADIIRRHRPQVVLSVPTLYRNLLRDGMAATPEFAAVRAYVAAGERLPESVFDAWMTATGQPICEGIGSSEALFLFIANTPAAHKAGKSGRVLPWVEARLTDEAGRPLDRPDEPGALWVRMDSLTAGYWQAPDKTTEAFQDGWYRTGDMMSVDADGWWTHHGRGDDLLKISGQWVSPAEIEEAALAAGELADAAAVGVVNSDGLVRLALFVVSGDARLPDHTVASRVQAALQTRLSIYKCPRTVRVVEEIPRTSTGKVQRFRLRQMLDGEAVRA